MTKKQLLDFFEEFPSVSPHKFCKEAGKDPVNLRNIMRYMSDGDHFSRTVMKWLGPLITKYGGKIN